MEPVVTGGGGRDRQPWTLVWIDASEAHLMRWHDGRVATLRIESDIPTHHRSTGHVRHTVAGRTHAGPPRSAGETHRLEHVRRFIAEVARHLPADDELAVHGPGTIARQLAEHLVADDRRHRRSRGVAYRRMATRTPAQLSAEVRRLAGDEAPRRPVRRLRTPDVGRAETELAQALQEALDEIDETGLEPAERGSHEG
ncbi:MAG TPA: hypothetical protein VH741_00615 [Candidatus Limnocylindrales bacterium]